MEIESLNSILYLQYNTIAEEAHSHPVCEGFFSNTFRNLCDSLNRKMQNNCLGIFEERLVCIRIDSVIKQNHFN